MNRQSFSMTAFATGLTTFLGVATEIVSRHPTFSSFANPLGVLHLFVLGAAFVTMLGGALGYQMPRSADGGHAERATDLVVRTPTGRSTDPQQPVVVAVETTVSQKEPPNVP